MALRVIQYGENLDSETVDVSCEYSDCGTVLLPIRIVLIPRGSDNDCNITIHLHQNEVSALIRALQEAHEACKGKEY